MPLSIYQILLKKKPLQAEFHPRNNPIIILYPDGELQSISQEGKEDRIVSFDCDPVAFRINARGDLIALLGKGKLYFHNLLTLNSSCIDVDEKIRLLEFYKDSVLISGFQNNILLIKENGSIQKMYDLPQELPKLVKTIQGFLREGLINRLIITRIPILLGAGIRLFGALAHDVKLRHLGTRQFENGLVQNSYEVLKNSEG